MDKIIEKVKDLLGQDDTGHGFEHIERVYQNAMKFCDTLPNADRKIVALAALLHDCDDYKLFGEECANNLSNARKIMSEASIDIETQQQVCDIISNMGYSKRLAGIIPNTLEGKIVSDADMLDAMGAIGIIRCMAFALARCTKYGTPLFDKDTWPVTNMSTKKYKEKDRRSDNFINHFFEKMLKLDSMLLTPAGKIEGEERHIFMVEFLERFFQEQHLPEWQKYMRDYLKNYKISVRTREALKNLKASGKKLGRPKNGTSCKLQKKHKKVMKLLNSNLTHTEIARKLKCTRTTLYRYIKVYINNS